MNIASKTKNDKFQENLSRPGIIDARARYRRLRNTVLKASDIRFNIKQDKHPYKPLHQSPL